MKFWIPFLCCASSVWAGNIPEWVYWGGYIIGGCIGSGGESIITAGACVKAADEALQEHQKKEEEVHQQQVMRQIEVWKKNEANLESLNDHYQKTCFCAECKSLLDELIRAQQSELKNNIELILKDQQLLFTQEIRAHGEIILLQEEALLHLRNCNKCKSECTRFAVIKQIAGEKQLRSHYLDCAQAWHKEGYQNLSEKKKEEAFQKRLAVAVQISTIINNLTSAMASF